MLDFYIKVMYIITTNKRRNKMKIFLDSFTSEAVITKCDNEKHLQRTVKYCGCNWTYRDGEFVVTGTLKKLLNLFSWLPVKTINIS